MSGIKPLITQRLWRYFYRKSFAGGFQPICGAKSFLVSFPRSGSNFLQNVLAKSSNKSCESLYGAIWAQPKTYLSLKSHAISEAWLLDEIDRYSPQSWNNPKIIYIYRDPRDVMVSFWEFVQYRKKIKIPQEFFIDQTAYDYATFESKDPVLDRRVEWAPLSVGNAYRKHYNNWILKNETETFRIFKFEEMLRSPKVEFERLFTFLGIKCEIEETALSERVSLYGDGKSRGRGQHHGWKTNYNKYKSIVDRVERNFSDILETLGYL